MSFSNFNPSQTKIISIQPMGDVWNQTTVSGVSAAPPPPPPPPPTETFTEIYNVPDQGTTFSILGPSDNDSVGERITSASSLVGLTVKRVTIRLKKTGSPTGTASIVVKNSAGTIVHTFGTLDVNSLSTTEDDITFTASSSHTFSADDRVLIEYTDTASISIKRTGSDAFDGTATHRQSRNTGSASYSNQTDQDIIGIWYSSNL